jgi:thymidine kinase
MVTEGDQILLGDVGTPQSIGYEVLCRKHHMQKLNSARAKGGRG